MPSTHPFLAFLVCRGSFPHAYRLATHHVIFYMCLFQFGIYSPTRPISNVEVSKTRRLS